MSFAPVANEHFVGEPAELRAVFSGGTGRIDPGGIGVSSGQTVQTPRLATSTTFRLTVSGGSTAATRDLTIDVRYRERLRTLSMPFARRGHVSVELQDGRILVIGGADASATGYPTSNYAFDPETESFAEFGALIDPRIRHAAVLLGNGNILVVGGDTRLDTREAELIDGRTGVAFTTGAPVVTRFAATATLLADGRVLLAAGFAVELVEGDVVEAMTATAELYDPGTGQFTPTAGTLSHERIGHSATLLPDGRVLIYGGLNNRGSTPLPPEIYDPQTQRFTIVQLPEATVRTNHVALALQDGKIGIFGGEDYFFGLVATNLRFDPTNGVFEPLGTLVHPRTQAQGTVLTDGRVLLAGGTAIVQRTANTEILSPADASSVDGPRMSADRVQHTVNRLRNGKVLIVGGLESPLTTLATAEIFE
jgi:hypothetical protein